MDVTKIILIGVCVLGLVGFAVFSWRFENIGNTEKENSTKALEKEKKEEQ